MRYLYMAVIDLAALAMIVFAEVSPLITPRQTCWFLAFGLWIYFSSGVKETVVLRTGAKAK